MFIIHNYLLYLQLKLIMPQDILFDFIDQEKQRQTEGIEMIASENFVSESVMQAMGSILTNKYAEGYPGKRYYGGCEVIDEIENLAIKRLKKLFGAQYVNVQPHSGSQANAAVFLACLKPGDSILGFNLSHGGHLSHGSPISFSGIIYHAFFYGVKKETEIIDYEEMRKIARKEKPKLIICGASSYSRDIDYTNFREVANEIGAILVADISHPSGLIATHRLNNPMQSCHIVTTTTHKTLRGPRGGAILLGRDFENPFGLKTPKGEIKMMSQLIDSAVFPGIQGGPLEHVIAAKAVAFQEALSENYQNYTAQIIKNTQELTKALLEKKYRIVSGGSDNHLILIDLRNKNLSGKETEKILSSVDITCNKNMVPFDDKSPFITSGVRLGTSAITTRGLLEKDMLLIAEWIDIALTNNKNSNILHSIKKQVNELMRSKPLFVI